MPQVGSEQIFLFKKKKKKIKFTICPVIVLFAVAFKEFKECYISLHSVVFDILLNAPTPLKLVSKLTMPAATLAIWDPARFSNT